MDLTSTFGRFSIPAVMDEYLNPGQTAWRKVFGSRPHVILPVVHVETTDQALRNAERAQAEGCDGVFLINHSIRSAALLKIAGQVCERFSDWWIGVNCLELEPESVFRALDKNISGVWADDAGIDEEKDEQLVGAAVSQARRESGWRGLYFGGVAFKYQRPVEDLYQAARKASQFIDVVTTSGAATGQPPQREKIAMMKSALQERPLAIASGITPENVRTFLDVADCFLVATGISRSFTELEPLRIKALVAAVRASGDIAQS